MLQILRTIFIGGFVLATACSGSAEIGAPTTSPTTSTTTSTTSTTTTSTTTIPLVVVPDLRGYDRNQAADVLRELGLFATFVEKPDEAEEGTVTGTTPNSGQEVEPGSAVEIRYAVPIVHQVVVVLDIRDNLWSDLPDEECEFQNEGVKEGQSVTLAGPDGVLLGSALVTNGRVESVGPGYGLGKDYVGDVCRFVFVFPDIPQVATYGFATRSFSAFPTVSLATAKAENWLLQFGIGY